VNWALYNGDLRFAVTVHLMDSQIDHGQIISVTELDILPIDTVSSLLQRTHEMRLSVFLEFVDYLSEHGDDLNLQTLAEQYDGPAWGDKTYSIKEIDKLQIIDTRVDLVELNRIIRSTLFLNHRPYIELHGHRFLLADD